jgi:heat shock protein HslJ
LSSAEPYVAGSRQSGMRPQRGLARLAVVVLLLGAVAACAGSGGKSGGGSGLGSEPDTTVAGTWRPVMITGYEPPAEYPDGFRTATISFNGAGGWLGSDGCNRLSGTYVFHGDGRLETTVGPSTLIGCANVPNAAVLAAAVQARLDGQQLTLLDKRGVVLARYERVNPTTAAAT